MEDLVSGGKRRVSDDVSSRGEQKSPHPKSTSSPSHSSTSPHSILALPSGGSYLHHPPPPSQPPPPPPSQSGHGKTRPAPQVTSQGEPLLTSRGFPQEKQQQQRDSVLGMGQKEEGGAFLKTTKLLGSDIHHGHHGASRPIPHPHGGPPHEDRRRGSSSPDQDSWHTSSDTHLPLREDVFDREGNLTQSYSPQMPHRHHDNNPLHASNSDTKLIVSTSSPSNSSSSVPRLRGNGGESTGTELPKGVETTRVVINSKADVNRSHRGGRGGGGGDYIFTRVVNRSEGTGLLAGGLQKAAQMPNPSNQSIPNALTNNPNVPTAGIPLQPSPSVVQPDLSNVPNHLSPHLIGRDHCEGVSPSDKDVGASGDQSRSKGAVPSQNLPSRSPEGNATKDSIPSNLQDMPSLSSSTEELSKFHEDKEEDTISPVVLRPTAMAPPPSNHAHQRGIQPAPPPQSHSHYQHHIRPTYNAQGPTQMGGMRGMDSLPLPPPPPPPSSSSSSSSLPQPRSLPSQQYEKVVFGPDGQLSYHRPTVPKMSHEYSQEDYYHPYSGGPTLTSDTFVGPQGVPQSSPLSVGGGYKSQSKLVRVDPAQMGSKTKVTIAHDAAVKGDMATLRFLLSSHEIDPVCADECGSSLVHKAAQYGHLAILKMLCSDLPSMYLQAADSNFDTPAMLAVQGGHVECLQYLVQEGGVPLEVKDAGGETLLHHAAYHGQHRCLELLLKLLKTTQKTDQPTEILDDSGVTPAHFAAQRGHLECLQLLMNYGYSAILPDREGQKPSDWADAMGQAICTRYLIMVETSWALSQEVSRLGEQVHILRKQNEQLKEVLKFQEQEHRATVGKLQQEHDLKVTRMKEQYIDLTTSLLKDIGQNTKPAGSDQKDGPRPQQSAHGKKSEAPTQGSKSKPPPGTEGVGKRKPTRPAPVMERSSQAQLRDGEAVEQTLDEIDYRATTPQEVLRRQLTSVEQRMNASREIRRKRSVMAASEGKSTDKPPNKPQNHTSEQQERRPMKVKFAANVTEIGGAPERQGNKQQAASPSASSSPLHTSLAQGTKDSNSDSAAPSSGSDSRSHVSDQSHGKKS